MLDIMYYLHSRFATFLNINQKLLISEEFIFDNLVKYYKKKNLKSKLVFLFFLKAG